MKDETIMASNFIHNMIDADLENGNVKKIHTRFPPEPNGYLHVGHAKAILINYLTAKKYGGEFNLRFDDTNPVKEDVEYVNSIKEDIQWLGCQWDHLFYASDYFGKMYDYAMELVKKGLAFVDDQTAEEISDTRGSLTEPGVESPYRNRSIEENASLFEKMKKGDFPDGSRVLRAKIDMSSPNINMRDPVIYRIARATHHNTGDEWCIYPMYDFAHPIEDAIEGISHSLCSLEFENHRPLYDWVLMNLDDYKVERPRQIEFAKLFIKDSVLGKRYLKKLVDDGKVEGWDDPRLETISGMRRRGFTPESLRDFTERIGVAKSNSIVDRALLEYCVREDLKLKAKRKMAVLKPLKVTITNYPEGQVEWLDDEDNTDNENMGVRKVPFSKHLYVEQEDFMENPPKKYHRLYVGNEVRFRKAYFITCNDVVRDAEGKVIELLCTYDPETKSGSGFEGRKVKGTIHWVSADHAMDATVRLYENLVIREDEEDENSELVLNPNSLITLENCKLEPSFVEVKPGEHVQFLRNGYFVADTKLSTAEHLVFNRVVSLKSSYKI
ncbi:glutamine--tRNA ligase/YqeY domain fusion protein [Fusibacter ferrireducens]|uniref:Glutamine--tRNA ligase n=1 Tax=Fusibacter ferrireducens TaxID=2785058 RepID=A0ABR9ZWP5_9FIRM|nr:glutamine--tRNA ligase/YqeY domain fusion protein [Fusibacter ferrireducens]MBF4694039.1 glutamine--tRNA ligase/YqeY domain fusion protein [Fusibacter ferrireducens]